MVLGQVLAVFRLSTLQNYEFQGYFPKIEVFGRPQLIVISLKIILLTKIKY
jgi:hypothetical protein